MDFLKRLVNINDEIDNYVHYIIKLLSESEAIKKMNIQPNYDNWISFIIAEIDFRNHRKGLTPKYKASYTDLIYDVRNRVSYKDILEQMNGYNAPNLNSASFSLTRVYMKHVWGITDRRLSDPIQLTFFSKVCSGLREFIMDRYEKVMIYRKSKA
ncbi:hypothetical protein C3K47_11685 [Solitalea longa]|uniref:Uncharacterized protein n=1 Tax=Solitalea longa TaxID=2079460 RepID=A0A2S5A1E1_9SPHI|nr:hypothetical protein [Solitalea longa]POY36401.1 hypothetical protein C3K47_11685 [Solitalea longa]